MHPRRSAAVLVVLALAAACGGDGDDDSADATTTTAVDATSPSSGAGGDEAALEALVLQEGDFPPGWTSEPAEPDEADDTGEDLEACLGIAVDDDSRPEAESRQFTQGPLTQASSSVSLAPDQAAVDTEFAAIQGPKFAGCAEQAFDAAADEDPEVAFAPSRAELLEFPDVGDGVVASRLSTTVTAEGQQIPIYADLVFVRQGLAELSFSFINAGEPFPTDLATELVQKVLARA